MHFKKLALLVVSSAALFAVGCGGGTEAPGATCTTDLNCKSTEICHPNAKICVKTCNSATDCPSTEKNCAALAGAAAATDGGVQKICQCTTNELCNSNAGGSNICSSTDHVCVVKCSTDSACAAGKTCQNGECVGGGTTCTPLCGAGQACQNGTCVAGCSIGSCASGQTCSAATSTCQAAATCSTGSGQPSTCTNGEFCSNNSCADVPKATCANLTNHTTGWNAASTGQVIYDVTKVSFAPNAVFCSDPTATERAKVHVKAYAGPSAAEFPANEAGLQGVLHYVKADGTEGDLTNTIQNLTRSNNNKNAEFDLNFCRPNGATTLSLGLHFVNGNGFCAQVAHD